MNAYDNRGPKLISPLDSRVATCFDPVSRFGDWYNDRPTGDVNRPFLIDIKFTWNASKHAYEYIHKDCFPLDNGKTFRQLGPNPPYGHLLSAPNNIHNYGFTMEFHARFTYFKGKAQTDKINLDVIAPDNHEYRIGAPVGQTRSAQGRVLRRAARERTRSSSLPRWPFSPRSGT